MMSERGGYRLTQGHSEVFVFGPAIREERENPDARTPRLI
jgi:hypothetical protein